MFQIFDGVDDADLVVVRIQVELCVDSVAEQHNADLG